MPDRFNALYGAGKAAEGSGDAAKARKHYGRLLEVTAGGEGTRAEIKHARAYLAVKP